ncbi:MAG: hypothetical protein U1F81_06885 [Verrucomicrobiaceae bacterium]
MSEPTASTNYYLLTGEDLRVFLNQEAITVTVLRQILRGRGVFCPSNDKKDLLPFLLLSFLTPEEFETLLDAVRSKEESHKVRSHTFSVPFEGKTLEEVMPVDLPIAELAADPLGNYEVVGVPMITAEKDGGKPSCVVRLKLRRTTIGSDLTANSRHFESQVRWTLDVDAKRLLVTTIHTSRETEQANQSVVRVINKHLREQQFIEPGSEFRLCFKSFTNEQRIVFLMQFSGLDEWNGLSFERLKGLALKLDETKTPPDQERLNWMRKKVSRVNLNGDALQDTFFVTDTTCRPYIICWRMEMVFKFTTADHSGKLEAVFEFADYANGSLGTAEFQIAIPSLSISGKPKNHPDCRLLADKFVLKLNSMKQQAHDKAVAIGAQ